MYTDITDKSGNLYEVHVPSHHKPPGFDDSMLLNTSSVWILYDNKWYQSKHRSQRKTVEDIKSIHSVEELMALWGVDASEVVPKPEAQVESGMAQRVMLDSTDEYALKCYSCVEDSYLD